MSPAGIRRREPRRIDEARRVSSRERANQSNLRVETTIKLPTFWHIVRCPRRESNPHLRFRKPPFYPLNYGDQQLEKEYTD
jgi:hypothetical protein